jgi:hypothetical protein
MAGSKLNKTETDKRVQECYDKRYNQTPPIGVKHWIEYCHETYGDKSEQQYTHYWMSAKEIYEETWRSKLESQLDPAMDKLMELLNHPNPQISQRAVDQVLKYTGNSVDKVEANVNLQSVKLSWGNNETKDGE